MKPESLINNLKSYGVSVNIDLNYRFDMKSSPEAEELLIILENNKQAVINYLISQSFIQLPENICLPSEWVMTDDMKKYVFEAPQDMLKAIENGHDSLFCLLYCLKALCFINMRKELYLRLKNAMLKYYNFNYTEYVKEVESERDKK